MRIDHINLPRIFQFVRVVEQGSINRAAQRLGLTQPALTRNMKKLEDSLGVPLIDRSSRGVRATIYGELLIQHAVAIRTSLQQVLEDIETIAGNKDGAIRIGATPFAAVQILAVAAAAFQLEYPTIRIRAIDGTRPTLLAQLRAGDLDLVLTTVENAPERGLLEKLLYVDKTNLWVCSSHPFSRRKNISTSEIATQKWVLPISESNYRAYVENELAKIGITISGPVIETSSPHIIRSLILQGRIAALPSPISVVDMDSGNIIALNGPWQFQPRKHGLYQRITTRQLPTLQAMIQTLEKIARELDQPLAFAGDARTRSDARGCAGGLPPRVGRTGKRNP